ncbi:unnamed protein product [Gongylonema pulchrum]|uniref:DNA_pol_D_N domain-containing protein n=1 Tax=Gongylonema pulchrum TaxID=637853 RepID=A0A183EE66_9BILA|nr:unnamed protein product [Gongylonema pulchrum]
MFWELMRSCAQHKIKISKPSYDCQSCYLVGDVMIDGQDLSNLIEPTGALPSYYKVGTVIEMCGLIRDSDFSSYLEISTKSDNTDCSVVAEPVL